MQNLMSSFEVPNEEPKAFCKIKVVSLVSVVIGQLLNVIGGGGGGGCRNAQVSI